MTCNIINVSLQSHHLLNALAAPFNTQWVKMEKYRNKELLDKSESGNKIVPLQHKRRAKRGMHAEGMQFYCPSSTYPAIVFLVLYYFIS